VVLRHQLMVVRRQVARPRYAQQDRLVSGMLSRLLPAGSVGHVSGYSFGAAALASGAGRAPLDVPDHRVHPERPAG
jgi:hypothetical protein